ncbi:MAG: hypothetical protein DHS20C01_21970 [marine bacterium B5-7]|nr:MAG: hypothetical protein DHS20C01_21970 [marine bacterium B5-7]
MRLRLTPEAYADLDNIHSYIADEQQRPQTAAAVVRQIEQSFERISNHPRIGRVTPFPDTREYTIASLPFTVIYRLRDEWVEIITIFHESQHPDKKRR